MMHLSGSFTFSKSVKTTSVVYRQTRRKFEVQQKIDDFIDERVDQSLFSNDQFKRFIQLIKQQFDVNTIILSMIYYERFKNEFIFSSVDELMVSSFILADMFLNDKQQVIPVLKIHQMQLENIDQKLYELLDHCGDMLFVEAEDFNAYKAQMDMD
ncbi:Hypothetical_protein [Hexamita inflata]|uniref:Hypothetical_protein n=1 Tax=Hexamita inflata TaxID=28002 RepID=A0AA86QSF8_9EUKA|nr:Hypothetical protein HINF_LOCUS47572 [Hexamita inflata]